MKPLETEAIILKHFIKGAVVSTALLVGTPLVATHFVTNPSVGTAGKTLAFAQSLNITPQAADAIAVAKVGNGTVIKTSLDTYKGQKVYDIHVQSATKIWDVKILVTTGSVVMARLANEQPSSTSSVAKKPDSSAHTGSTAKLPAATTTIPTPTTVSSPPPTTTTTTSPTSSISSTAAENIAISAVGGGTIQHISNDTYKGVAVYDIHVLASGTLHDVKVSQTTGAVLENKVSQESGSTPPASSQQPSTPSQDAPDSTPSTPVVTTASTSGIVFNQKLSTVPATYQSSVTSAIAQVGGGTLKWVKFITKSSGDIEMNIKIRLATKGTIKVKDVFSPNGQLLTQSLNS